MRRIVRWADADREVEGGDVRAWRQDYIESCGGRNSPDWRESDDLVVGDDVPAADVLPASPELWYNVGWGRGAVVKC